MLITRHIFNLFRGTIPNKHYKCLISLNICHIQRYIFTGEKRKEYHARKLVGFSAKQMFYVVADVKNYKNFVPFCKKSKVIKEGKESLTAQLQIGFPPIVESYTSHVTLKEHYLIISKCEDGSLFDTLLTEWRFSSGLQSNPKSCIIDFYIIFEFRSIFHSSLALMFFEQLVHQMEWAFIAEAKRRYGVESLPSHKLTVIPPKS